MLAHQQMISSASEKGLGTARLYLYQKPIDMDEWFYLSGNIVKNDATVAKPFKSTFFKTRILNQC